MDVDKIPGLIRGLVLAGRYEVKLHALQRINELRVALSEIKDALLDCRVVEDYPDDRRGHGCLVWGKSGAGRDLHLVCGITDEAVWVVTIYEPDSGRWETPLNRRPLT